MRDVDSDAIRETSANGQWIIEHPTTDTGKFELIRMVDEEEVTWGYFYSVKDAIQYAEEIMQREWNRFPH